MGYQVTKKYVPPAGSIQAPGEHYFLVDEAGGIFRDATFYRTAEGREVATDGIGHPLAQDGDLFRLIKAAVEKYDTASVARQPRPSRDNKGSR